MITIVLLLVLMSVLNLWLAYFARRRHERAAWSGPFVVLMLAISAWGLGYALELAVAELPAKITLAKIEYIGIVTTPVAWFVFALQYAGYERMLTRRRLLILSTIPVLTLLLVFSNEVHQWIWSQVRLDVSGPFAMLDLSYGWWFWLHSAYSYLLLLVGSGFLVRTFLRFEAVYRWQVAVLLLGTLAPWLGNALYITNAGILPNVDLTPLAFTVSGLILAWGISRFQLFDLMPVARRVAVRNMRDGLVVVDQHNRIVDTNPAARELLGYPEGQDVIGQTLDRLLPPVSVLLPPITRSEESSAEIEWHVDQQTRFYDVHASSLSSSRGRQVGRLLVFHDITARKIAALSLEAQNQLYESLVAMAEATSSGPGMESILPNTVRMATELTRADNGSLLLVDEAGRITDHHLSRREADQISVRFLDRVAQEGLAGWVLQRQEPALIADTTSDPRWLDLPGDEQVVRSALSIPIKGETGIQGVLTLQHAAPGHFGQAELQILSAAAAQMTLALHNAKQYERQRRLARMRDALHKVLRSISGPLNREVNAQTAVDIIAELTGWTALRLLTTDVEESQFTVLSATGPMAAEKDEPLSLTTGIRSRAYWSNEPQFVERLERDPDWDGQDRELLSAMVVPLTIGNRRLGVLEAYGAREASFDRDDMWLIESLAEAIAMAIDNTRVHQELNQYAANLSTLYAVTRVSSRSLDLDDVLEQTLYAAQIALGYDAGLIALVDPVDEQLYLAAERRLPEPTLTRLCRDRFDDTLCDYVHTHAEAMQVADVDELADWPVKERAEQFKAQLRQMNMRACSGIPLLHQGRSIGALCLFGHNARTLSREQISLQRTIGQQLATAVANIRLFQTAADERGRLSALIESSRDGIILVSMDRRVLVVNEAASQLLGVPGSSADWVHKPIQDVDTLIGKERRVSAGAILSQLMSAGAGLERAGGELEIPPRIVAWRRVVVTAESVAIGSLLILQDVTEKRRLDMIREDLMHMIVHDLRNPIGVVTGVIEIVETLAGDSLDPRARDLLTVARRSNEKMAQLVEDILDISRLESGQLPIEFGPVSLNDLIREVLASQAPLAADKEIGLYEDICSTLPDLWVDRGLIERVLQNLVDNATKFTPPGGEINIVARCDQVQDQKQIQVAVVDNGPGVPAELRDHLFEKFATGRDASHGSGLGLAFCKMVVEAHGGQIWLEDGMESGTTINLTLPLVATAVLSTQPRPDETAAQA